MLFGGEKIDFWLIVAGHAGGRWMVGGKAMVVDNGKTFCWMGMRLVLAFVRHTVW